MENRETRIQAGPDLWLEGDWVLPVKGHSMVVFAHGSGSSRFSPRNRYVAEELNRAGLGTLLFDLLTREEELQESRTGHFRFDIELLASRLTAATDWLVQQEGMQDLSIGYFGSSTGAGAALLAAAERPRVIQAVVSRGGRPDLAGEALARVHAATLLIVGSRDLPVIRLNDEAMRQLASQDKRMVLIEGATHLFEEPGTLEEVARLASGWFERYLKREPRAA
jgi:dienelactone hydrolase